MRILQIAKTEMRQNDAEVLAVFNVRRPNNTRAEKPGLNR